MIDAPPNSPVARAPAPLRAAVDAAAEAFRADETHSNWTLLQVAIQACIDHDDARKARAA